MLTPRSILSFCFWQSESSRNLTGLKILKIFRQVLLTQIRCCNFSFHSHICCGYIFRFRRQFPSDAPHRRLGPFPEFLLSTNSFISFAIHATIATNPRINFQRSLPTHVVNSLLAIFLLLGRPHIFASGVRQLYIMTAAQIPNEVVIMKRRFHILASHDATQGHKRVVGYCRVEGLIQLLISWSVIQVFSFLWEIVFLVDPWNTKE